MDRGSVGPGLGRTGVAHSDLDFSEFFRIGNRQVAANCRFGIWFSNRQLDSESETGANIGYVMLWLGCLGLALGKAGKG